MWKSEEAQEAREENRERGRSCVGEDIDNRGLEVAQKMESEVRGENRRERSYPVQNASEVQMCLWLLMLSY